MMFLTVQTALLLLAAYVLGAICGCWLHRLLAAPISAGDHLATAGIAISDQPMIETATGPAPPAAALSDANRFERALVAARAQERGPAPAEPPPAIEVGAPPPRDTMTVPRIAQPETPSVPATHEAAPGPSLPAAGSSGGLTGASAPLAPALQRSPDDLTRIHNIDPETASRLAELGVASYARLAALTRADVDRIEAGLGQQRISREGWIEQAQLLANGRETAFARRLAGGGAERASSAEIYGEDTVVETAPETVDDLVETPEVSEPQPAVPVEELQEDTTTAEIPEQPAELGLAEPENTDTDSAPEEVVAATEHEPATTESDVVAAAALAHETEPTDEPPSEPEQSSGPETDVAPEPVAAIETTSDVSVDSEAGQVTYAIDPPAVPAPVDEPLPAADDDLLRIRGMDADAAAILHANGVSRFEQIANWQSSEVRRFEGLIGPLGRIRQENWIEQAQILAKGGETAFSRRQRLEPAPVPNDRASLADAAPPEVASTVEVVPVADDTGGTAQADLSGLRSVRSPLLTGGEAKPEAHYDDLKRIRGIGVLIEKKLNSLGISRYDQIANWTAAEIDRISQVLDFKGRIERESWVEQARILASGGQTEFSSRIDRG